MKTVNGFTLFENLSEFKSWIDKQNVTRTINKLQVHHMGLPDYACWKQDVARWGKANAELRRTESLDSYGKKTWGSRSANGKYIAQHFNVFPNGKITTGRSLNSNPIGISGWNTNAVCVEIYGNFDRGKDIMTAEQKKAVIGLYAILAKRFNVPISTSNIRPHAWFTSRGKYLGDYIAGKSRKTCPGTNFMGYGVSKAGFAKFIADVKAYNSSGAVAPKPTPAPTPTPTTPSGYKYIVKYLQQVLNSQYSAGLATDGLYGPKTEAAIKAHILKQGAKGDHVVWLQKALINRGQKITADGSFGPATLAAVKAYQKSRGLTADGIAGLATHKAIIND